MKKVKQIKKNYKDYCEIVDRTPYLSTIEKLILKAKYLVNLSHNL